jgi:hypothetical protein
VQIYVRNLAIPSQLKPVIKESEANKLKRKTLSFKNFGAQNCITHTSNPTIVR